MLRSVNTESQAGMSSPVIRANSSRRPGEGADHAHATAQAASRDIIYQDEPEVDVEGARLPPVAVNRDNRSWILHTVFAHPDYEYYITASDNNAISTLGEPLVMDASLQQHPAMSNIPRGRWRKEFVDFCNLCGTAAFVNAICCPSLLIRQISRRMNTKVCCIPATILWFLTPLVLGPLILMVLFPWFFLIFFVMMIPVLAIWILCHAVMAYRLRHLIASRYDIEDQHDSTCDDFALSCCCLPCSLMQMASHTADLDLYRSCYCSPTGLGRASRDAP